MSSNRARSTQAEPTHESLYTSPTIDAWSDEDHLLLLECWARDGYQFGDIAQRIGIGLNTLIKWRQKSEKINNALNQGRELIDYKVENALLKSALGYKTREVKVTTTMRNGRVVETIEEVLDKEQAPNVSAIQCWLYNRRSDKWRNMNSRANLIDELGEDANIEITITKAGSNPNTSGAESNEDDKEWQDEINNSVSVKTKTKKQMAEDKKKAEAAKKDRNKKGRSIENPKTKIEENDEEDLDYWPEDWEDSE